MKKLILIAFLFLFNVTSGFSQSNPLDKKLEKALEMAKKGKLEDADEYLTKLLKDNPDFGSGWDLLVKVRYGEYKESKKSDNLGGFTITSTDKDGKKIENDSLSQALAVLMNNLKPSQGAYDKYKYTMRKATASSQDAFYSSALLRSAFIDPEVDTNVNSKALKYFKDAEEQFGKSNYNDAAKLYLRSIELQPDFYKASLYLGDCYYFTENYMEAINSFKKAVDKFPDLLEPRKYLIDAYMKQRFYDNALEAGIATMSVYPDQSIAFGRMEEIAFRLDKKFDIKWTARPLLPNSIRDTSGKEISVFIPDEEKVSLPWTYYMKAKKEIENSCNMKGIVNTPNALTSSKYMEVFSWEEMLKNSEDPSLAEARRMQKDGFLDCYVLVTCFHYDFYEQYKDFVSKNKDKVTQYFNKYLIAKNK